MYKILVIGELCLDIIVRRPKSVSACGEPLWAEEIELAPGGSAFYAGSAFRALGLPPAVQATVGDDWEGEWLLRELSETGLSAGRIRPVAGMSTQKCIVTYDGNRQHFVASTPPTSGVLDALELPSELALIYVAGYLLYPEMWTARFADFLSQARGNGTKVVLDTQCLPVSRESLSPALRLDVFRNLDALLLNAAEARLLTDEEDVERAARRLSALGDSTVVVKLGAEGSLAYQGGECIRRRAFPVDVLDTVGGGDVFGAAFSYGLLRGWFLGKVSDFANAAAALSLTDRDGRKRVPGLDEVTSHLAAARGVSEEVV